MDLVQRIAPDTYRNYSKNFYYKANIGSKLRDLPDKRLHDLEFFRYEAPVYDSVLQRLGKIILRKDKVATHEVLDKTFGTLEEEKHRKIQQLTTPIEEEKNRLFFEIFSKQNIISLVIDKRKSKI